MILVVPLPDGNAETVTADRLPGDRYLVTSIPVFTEQVHYRDIVACKGDPPVFSSLEEPSGYVTVQVVFVKPALEDSPVLLASPIQTAPLLQIFTDAAIHVEHVAGNLYMASFPADRHREIERMLDDCPQALLRWWHTGERKHVGSSEV